MYKVLHPSNDALQLSKEKDERILDFLGRGEKVHGLVVIVVVVHVVTASTQKYV